MEPRDIDGRRRSPWLGLMVAGAIALGSACSSPAQTETRILHGKFEIMTQQRIEERNARTIQRLVDECIQGGRLELLPELVASDYRDGAQGPEALEGRIDALRAGIPDLRFTVEELIAAGDRVVLRWSGSGTHAGELGGFAPTHETVTVRGVAIYQLRNGKIVGDWLLPDRLAFLQQIGALPAGLESGDGARDPLGGLPGDGWSEVVSKLFRGERCP